MYKIAGFKKKINPFLWNFIHFSVFPVNEIILKNDTCCSNKLFVSGY